MELFTYKTISSPVGALRLVCQGQYLVAILWDDDKPSRVKLGQMVEDPAYPFLLNVEEQLRAYFARQSQTFEIPFKLRGTPFQQEVWQKLLHIPYGSSWAYREIALQLGRPRAFRAVGAAIGRNPLSIVIPCHRVVGANGSLTGFAGGLDRKKILLDLEQR